MLSRAIRNSIAISNLRKLIKLHRRLIISNNITISTLHKSTSLQSYILTILNSSKVKRPPIGLTIIVKACCNNLNLVLCIAMLVVIRLDGDNWIGWIGVLDPGWCSCEVYLDWVGYVAVCSGCFEEGKCFGYLSIVDRIWYRVEARPWAWWLVNYFFRLRTVGVYDDIELCWSKLLTILNYIQLYWVLVNCIQLYLVILNLSSFGRQHI